MFYAAENLLMAVFSSENVDFIEVRLKHGNHQLDGMLDALSDECVIKSRFESVIGLVAYATTYRYASSTGKLSKPPSDEEAHDYFDTLVEILNICTTHFRVNVTLEEPEAGSIAPIR